MIDPFWLREAQKINPDLNAVQTIEYAVKVKNPTQFGTWTNAEFMKYLTDSDINQALKYYWELRHNDPGRRLPGKEQEEGQT